MKDVVNVYIEPENTADLMDWASEFKTSRSKAAAVAIKIGLKHKEEMYNQLDKEWRERYAI